MKPLTGLSDEALNFLDKEVSHRDRSARNLPGMRAKAKAVAMAEAPRAQLLKSLPTKVPTLRSALETPTR